MLEALNESNNNWKLGLYFFAIFFFLFLFVIYTFGYVEMRTDKFAFFLASIVLVLLVLPVVASIKFFDIIDVRKDPSILRWKKR